MCFAFDLQFDGDELSRNDSYRLYDVITSFKAAFDTKMLPSLPLDIT